MGQEFPNGMDQTNDGILHLVRHLPPRILKHYILVFIHLRAEIEEKGEHM